MGSSLLFVNPKHSSNVGTMCRNAELLGIERVFVSRYERTKGQVGATDTAKSWKRIMLLLEDDIDFLRLFQKSGGKIVSVELSKSAKILTDYTHVDNTIYVFGAEDTGIPEEIMKMSDCIVTIPSNKDWSFNVSDSATMVMYDRLLKSLKNVS